MFYAQGGFAISPEPNYIAPIGTRQLDKTKPSVTLAGEVNIDNGAANYTLPLAVPAGIQGMQPNLAITYNSNGGNGQLGLGWALAGASVISRGGSSYFVDNQVAPVTLTTDDNLYLDGQRLVKHGTAQNFAVTDQYRTLTKSYQKIEFIDGDVIKVTQKDGVTLYYGGTHARLQLTEPTSQTLVTHTWFLFKVEDRNRNYMTYDYAIDASKNEVRLNKINYTANDGESVTAKTEVQFRYATRTDARSGFVLGNEIHNSLLLKSITVMHNNTQYSKYTLNYMFDQTPKLGNDFSKLVEIQYQAQTEELNSVVVRWDGMPHGEYGFQPKLGHSSTINENGFELAGDFTGDGKTDLLILHHSEEDDDDCWSLSNRKFIMNTFHEYHIELKRRTNTDFQQAWTSPVFRSEWWQQACHREAWARIYPGDFMGMA